MQNLVRVKLHRRARGLAAARQEAQPGEQSKPAPDHWRNLTMRSLYVSATYTYPFESTATPSGELNSNPVAAAVGDVEISLLIDRQPARVHELGVGGRPPVA